MRRLFELAFAEYPNTVIKKTQLYDLMGVTDDSIAVRSSGPADHKWENNTRKNADEFRNRELSDITLRIIDSDRHRVKYRFEQVR